MRCSAPIPLILSLCALGSSAHAGGIIDVTLDREVAPWPANFTTDMNFESIQVADLNDDGPVDGVVRVGTELVHLPNLDDYTAPDLLLDAAGQAVVSNDFQLLAPTFSGGLGAVVSVGPSGLQVFRWNPATSKIELESVVGGNWIDARRIQVVDWDNDGVEDVIALSSTYDQVLVRLSPGTGGVDGTSIDLDLPASELIPVSWEANQGLGVAVLNGLGLEVRNHEGGVVYTRGTPLPSGSFARIQTAAPTDTIAWFTGPNGSGNSFVVSLDSSGVTGVLPIIDLAAGKIVPGDYDGDGDTDFAISFTNSTDLWLVEWDGSGVSSSNTILRVNGGASFGLQPIGSSPGTPVMADSNWDGELDLLIPSASEPGVVILHGNAVWTSGLLISDTPLIADFRFCIEPDSGNGRLSASFVYDATALEGFDMFEATLWEQPTPTSYVSQDGISTCPLLDSGSAGHLQSLNVPIPEYSFGPENYDETSGFPIIYYISVEPVDVNKRPVGAAIHAAFAIDQANAPWELAAPGAVLEVLELLGNCDEPLPDAAYGTVVSGGTFGSRRRGPHVPTKPPRKATTCGS